MKLSNCKSKINAVHIVSFTAFMALIGPSTEVDIIQLTSIQLKSANHFACHINVIALKKNLIFFYLTTQLMIQWDCLQNVDNPGSLFCAPGLEDTKLDISVELNAHR